VLVAAASRVDEKLIGFRGRGIVAVMNCLPDAAGMRLCRGGRQGQRGEVPHERNAQQKSGDQAMHAGAKMLEAYQFTDADSKTGR
jgi:hypothetical protein